MSIGHFIGRRIAEFVDFFRGRQAIPCTVDWDVQSGVYLAPPGAFAIPEAPTLAEIRGLQRAQGIVDLTFNFEDEKRDPLDDCCPDYDTDCCITTDTIGEIEGKK